MFNQVYAVVQPHNLHITGFTAGGTTQTSQVMEWLILWLKHRFNTRRCFLGSIQHINWLSCFPVTYYRTSVLFRCALIYYNHIPTHSWFKVHQCHVIVGWCITYDPYSLDTLAVHTHNNKDCSLSGNIVKLIPWWSNEVKQVSTT